MFKVGDVIRDKETGELYTVVANEGSWIEVMPHNPTKGKRGRIYFIHYEFFEKVA